MFVLHVLFKNQSFQRTAKAVYLGFRLRDMGKIRRKKFVKGEAARSSITIILLAKKLLPFTRFLRWIILTRAREAIAQPTVYAGTQK